MLIAALLTGSVHGTGASSAAAAGPAPLDARPVTEWWARPGGPGQVDDIHMGNGLPFTWMGIVAGGVALRDGLLPEFAPWPGVDEIAAPRAWYDSVEVVVGENAGWRGFSAALVELRTFAEPARTRRPRATFNLVNGTSGQDRTGLYLQRGGENSWLRGGAISDKRLGTGRLEARTQHVWFAELGMRRGAHTLTGAFSQRGAAGATRNDPLVAPPSYIGIEEAARGEAGALRWAWEQGDRRLRAVLSRSHDHRESFEKLPGILNLFSEREAQRNALELEAASGSDARGQALRLELTQGQVKTVLPIPLFGEPHLDGLTGRPEMDWRQASGWLAARAHRPMLGGRLELQLGGGHTNAPGRDSERFQLAPSAAWRRQQGSVRYRAHVGRFVTPVWSDLALGVQPFIQDTWTAGAGVGVGSERQWAEVSGVVAEIGNRALLQRWPIRDFSLRTGWVPDIRVQDAMVEAALGARRGAIAIDASMWSRVRPQGAEVARVDPAIGGRAGLEGGFKVFAGDLGVRLRAETAWVGDRETQPLVFFDTPPQPVPGYFTSSASGAFTIGDAEIVVRAYNLENAAHPQVWIDPTSELPGTPAAGSGRQFRVELSWPLFN